MSGAAGLARRPWPPGPAGLPLVGSLPEVLRRGIIPVLKECHARYGDVFMLRVAGFRLVVVAHADGIERVLRGNRENYVKGAIYDNLRVVMGEGLATVEGPRWKTRRRQLQPLFQPARTLAALGTLASIIERTLAGWAEQYRDGDEVDLFEVLSPLTLQVVSEVVCGLAVKDTGRLIGAFRTALEHLVKRGTLEQSIPLAVPTPGNVKARRALATLDAVAHEEIARARAEGAARAGDILGTLLSAKDPDSGAALTQRELRDELVTMLMAGHETVALTLLWCFERLGANPEVLEALTEEADRVLTGRVVDAGVLQELKYARLVVQEVLRVRSPAWIVARTCVAEDEIEGYRIPAGATVMLPQHLVHVHPRYWKEPERFWPERFTPEESKGRHEYAWFPFSKGPRMCIASHFGLLEATLALAMVARRLRLEPVAPTPEGFNALNALHPSRPLRMRVRWRH